MGELQVTASEFSGLPQCSEGHLAAHMACSRARKAEWLPQ